MTKRNKNQTGLLGEKRKKPMLFSFNARKGEEWSSDDSDEDFVLTDSESDVQKQPKKKKKVMITDTASDSKETVKKQATSGCDEDLWGRMLPVEVLTLIFQHVTREQGALPFLIRASRVNRLWNEASKAQILWSNVDLSYGWVKCRATTISWLAHHRLARITQLNLSMWKQLGYGDIQEIATHCPLLETIILAHCQKLKATSVQLIADSFKALHTLDLSACSSDALSNKSIGYLIEKRGSQLRGLILANNKIHGLQPLLGKIASGCHRLRVLDISNTSSHRASALNFPIEKLQNSWPELRVLRMANVYVTTPILKHGADDAPEESGGFPHLQELSLAYNPHEHLDSPVSPCFLQRMLKTSQDLRLLDLRGCQQYVWSALKSLPCTHVAQLYLSYCIQKNIHSPEAIKMVAAIINKWHKSLQELDLSKNPGLGSVCLELGFERLNRNPAPKLHSIDLSGTSSNPATVRHILNGCTNLRKLDLTSCRSLPRGVKRVHTGTSLKQLHKQLIQEGTGTSL